MSAAGTAVQQAGFLAFLSEHWLTLLFGLLGVGGTVYGILNGRKQKRAFGYLFRLAELNIEKDVTEQTLAVRREEIQTASARIEALQLQIRDDIPREARRAVLRDRLDSEIAALQQHNAAVSHLSRELEMLGEAASFPPEVLVAIQRQISPEYILRERRATLKNYLTIVTGLAGIASAVLPYPLGRWAGVPLMLVALALLVALTGASLNLRQGAQGKSIGSAMRWGSSALGLLLFASGLVFFLASVGYGDAGTTLGLVMAILGLALVALAGVQWVAHLRARHTRTGGRPLESAGSSNRRRD